MLTTSETWRLSRILVRSFRYKDIATKAYPQEEPGPPTAQGQVSSACSAGCKVSGPHLGGCNGDVHYLQRPLCLPGDGSPAHYVLRDGSPQDTGVSNHERATACLLAPTAPFSSAHISCLKNGRVELLQVLSRGIGTQVAESADATFIVQHVMQAHLSGCVSHGFPD